MKRTSGLLLAVACAAASAWLSAYVVTPGRTRWEAGRVALQVHLEGAPEARAASAAIEAWQPALARALDLEAAAPQYEPRLGNWRNDVAWADGLPPEVTSLTRIVTLSGRIVEADVSVARDRREGDPSLEQVLLHEIGHVVGLGHADDGGQIVRGAMASEPGRMTSRPSSDDEAGLVQLYSRTRPTPAWRQTGARRPSCSLLATNRSHSGRSWRPCTVTNCVARPRPASSTSKAPSSGRRHTCATG